MTRFSVRHATTFRYSVEVAASQSTLHVVPRPTGSQQVISHGLVSDPNATDETEYDDAFGNRTIYLAVERPHTDWTVTATSLLDVDPPAVVSGDVGWEELAAECRDGAMPPNVIEMSLPSLLVPVNTELAAFAAPSLRPGCGVVSGVVELTARIFREFVFDPFATDVTTPVLQVLEQRRGVCQDFAHLMVGCLRSLGLPARYVSGYLETEAPPGMTKLVGADASHAWVSVYVPGFGWLDADPTNGGFTTGRHITVGWGRDYSDVAPSRGVVFGPPGSQEITVAVDVSRL